MEEEANQSLCVWVTGQAVLTSRSPRGRCEPCPLTLAPPELPVRPCALPETVELMKMATLLDVGAGRGPA